MSAQLCLWDRLPEDLQALILQHRAAITLQCAWFRWSRYHHAKKQSWLHVRNHMGLDLWRRAIPFALVRREWRTEPESWLSADAAVMHLIADEARMGLWGSACPHQRRA